MEKNSPSDLPEILFGSKEPALSNQLLRWQRQGKIRKIAPRLYTSNLTDTPEAIVRRNLFIILGALFPGACVSHRSAIEYKPTEAGHIFLTHSYTKNLSLPGITVRFLKGPRPMEGDHMFTQGLFVAQKERALLECLQSSRQSGPESKTLPAELVESQLESILRVQGEQALNAFRDKAREISSRVQMEKEFEKLNKLIGALLSTQPSSKLRSPAALARALGKPYDPERIMLFEQLLGYLQQQTFPSRPDENLSDSAFRNFAFFESYFSNYIEGTEFEVEEAITIVDTGIPIPLRVEDSHDILGTYAVVSNRLEMRMIPETPRQLLELLQKRHAELLRARYDKQPGVFKQKNNRAGETHFVDHKLVEGTLIKGFEYYQALREPFARASFMMFLVSEVHPFMDGNGRVARVMMNAELVATAQARIIIPTVYRDDYLGALRILSRQQDPEPFTRMLQKAQAFSHSITGPDRTNMESKLRACDAFKEHTEGKLKIIP